MNSTLLPMDALGLYPQFILWKRTENANGSVRKQPLDPNTDRLLDITDASKYVGFDAIKKRASETGLGIGFVLTSTDPFFFIDVDNCITDTGHYTSDAIALMHTFNGCAIEISTSGKGLHIVGKYMGSIDHSIKSKILKADLFTSKRFIALTFNCLGGDSGASIPHNKFKSFVELNYPSKGSRPRASIASDESGDAILIERMCASETKKNKTGETISFLSLWYGDEDKLRKHFPSPDGGYDRSAADQSLCKSLAFWTKCNSLDMDRLFRKSKLFRDKWAQRDDYSSATINNGIAFVESQRNRSPNNTQHSSTPRMAMRPEGSHFMSVKAQMEYFKDVVYVQNSHRVFTPNGCLLTPERFKTMYGGYIFDLDSEGETKTKNAFEALTESRSCTFNKVIAVCFRPEIEPGSIITDANISKVNIYVPAEVERIEGDCAPFLDHVERLYPNPTDRKILLSYMAACVQHIGSKFQWAPIIQGAQGNGKSLFIRYVSAAIGREYTHYPNAGDLSNKFNSWISQKLFIGIHELPEQYSRHSLDLLNTMITEDYIEIQGKGVDQISGENRANFIICTNHKDALRISPNNRRFCALYTAQQNIGDIVRDGMAGDYFPNLYDWTRYNGGLAMVSHYLNNYSICPDYNPATLCHRAPETSSSREAYKASVGHMEQDIIEAIESNSIGFRNDWISTTYLGALLIKRRTSNTRKAQILNNLGYMPHPHLKNGRSGCRILEEGDKKPRLYIRVGSDRAAITSPSQVVAAYRKDQGWVAG